MFKHLGVDFEKGAPAASHRIVDQDIRNAVRLADVGNGVRDLALAGNVADHRMGVRKLLLERADPVRRTGQRDHAKSAARKAPDDRGPRAGTYTCDNGNWLVSHGLRLALARCPVKAGLRLSMKARTASL